MKTDFTKILAVSIGKAHETTNQEVQECDLKPHVSDSAKAVFKETQIRVFCVTTVLTRKDPIAPQKRDTAMPRELCVASARLKIILKAPSNVSNSKEREKQNTQIKGNQDQQGNHLS